MKPILFAFFGSSPLSVRVLDALEEQGLTPALVITAPDRRAGRGMEMTQNPVKEWALARTIEVATPATLRDDALAGELRNTEWDVFVVAMYGKIIPKNILEIPAHGCLNVHPSLLPRFRGPSPVLSAILADERTTGISIMQVTEAMDAGPVVAQARIELDADAWPPQGGEFEDVLATEGGTMLAEVLPDYLSGAVTPVPQDESLATYTKKFTDEDALLDFDPTEPPRGAAARVALCRIRAFDRSPRAHFFAQSKEGKTIRVIIAEAEIENDKLVITRVIPEGKKSMEYGEFVANFL